MRSGQVLRNRRICQWISVTLLFFFGLKSTVPARRGMVWLRWSGEQLGQENCNTASGQHATACFARPAAELGSEVIPSMGQVRGGVQRKEFMEAIQRASVTAVALG